MPERCPHGRITDRLSPRSSQAWDPSAAASNGVTLEKVARAASACWISPRNVSQACRSDRVAGRIEDHAAIDDAQGVIHAQPEVLEHRGEVPWINRLAIHGR